MRSLLACPFCHEMFPKGERRACPACGLALKKLDELPRAAMSGDDAEEVRPEDEVLPFSYWRRNRGALALVAVLGMVTFFMPWTREHRPERLILSGADVAMRLPWMWAALVAWMVMVPIVLSRRTVVRMRGARVAVAFLASFALATSGLRAFVPPKSTTLNPHVLSPEWGLYVNAGLALLALGLAWSFGGRMDVLTTQKGRRPDSETLH